VRPQHILIPVMTSVVLAAIVPVAGNASANHRAARANPASGGAHHQYVLTAPGGSKNDSFGSSVAIHKNIAVVGAPYRTVKGHRYAGVAYVFVRPASGWGHAKVTAVLNLAKPKTREGFGWSVAIAGNTIAVGAPGLNNGTNKLEGTVDLFTRPAGGWRHAHHPTGRLYPTDRTSRDLFGFALASSGRTFVVGAPTHVVGQHPTQGSAYVYHQPAGGWKAHNPQTAELTAGDGVTGIEVGYSVAISGTTIVAGAPYAQVGKKVGAGAVYVFRKPGSGWRNGVDTAKLTVRHPATAQYFGDAVAVTGSTVVGGAPDTKVSGHVNQGAAYVFTKGNSGWHDAHQNATLTVSPGNPNAYFGQGLAASGSRIVGAAYGLLSLFHHPGGHWSGVEHQKAQLSGTNALDFIGKAVWMSGSTIIAGAPTQLVGHHLNQGAAYVFVR